MRIPGLTNQKLASRMSRKTCRVYSQIWARVYTKMRNSFIAVSEVRVQLAQHVNDLYR